MFIHCSSTQFGILLQIKKFYPSNICLKYIHFYVVRGLFKCKKWYIMLFIRSVQENGMHCLKPNNSNVQLIKLMINVCKCLF